MRSLIIHMGILGLLVATIWMGGQCSRRVMYSSELKTEPTYYTPPVDTVSAPYLFIIGDYWLNFPNDWLGMNYNPWSLGCGGCIVYNEYYPGWNPGGFGSFNFPNPVAIASTDTLCRDTIKKVPIIEDYLIGEDSVPNVTKKKMRQKVMLFFQNLRSVGRKYQERTTKAKVRMDPNISENASPIAM
jgi:hypothetical protein